MSDSYKGHLVIVVALEHYNPLVILRTFGQEGIYPVYVGINYKAPVASASKYISACHHVDSIEQSYEVVMREYGHIGEQDPTKKPFLIFGDDDVYSYYELDHYDEMMSRFITFNAGEKGRVTHFMEKEAIQKCAARHGIPTLKSVVVPTGQIPEGIVYPVVTKSISPVTGGYKSDFFICENEEELKNNMALIKTEKVMIQPYVDKKTEMTIEAFTYNHGKGMFAGVECRYLYTIKGYYSPLFDSYLPKDKELLTKLNSMMEEIGFEGIWDAEFLVDKSDNIWFLEINFRHTPWANPATRGGNPLVTLWCEAMLTGKCREPQDFEPFATMVETVDYAKRVEEMKLCSFPQWLGEFKQCKCTMYYDEDDLEPWNVTVANWDILK